MAKQRRKRKSKKRGEKGEDEPDGSQGKGSTPKKQQERFKVNWALLCDFTSKYSFYRPIPVTCIERQGFWQNEIYTILQGMYDCLHEPDSRRYDSLSVCAQSEMIKYGRFNWRCFTVIDDQPLYYIYRYFLSKSTFNLHNVIVTLYVLVFIFYLLLTDLLSLVGCEWA